MVVLIAEDDELILKTIEHKLLKEGHEVILSRNGKEAIETLKNEQTLSIRAKLSMTSRQSSLR